MLLNGVQQMGLASASFFQGYPLHGRRRWLGITQHVEGRCSGTCSDVLKGPFMRQAPWRGSPRACSTLPLLRVMWHMAGRDGCQSGNGGPAWGACLPSECSRLHTHWAPLVVYMETVQDGARPVRDMDEVEGAGQFHILGWGVACALGTGNGVHFGLAGSPLSLVPCAVTSPALP